MKVLMFGWEFPPHISGGLGTACFGLTKALAKQDVEILFVLPRAFGDENTDSVRLINASDIILRFSDESSSEFLKRVTMLEVNSLLLPYTTPEEYHNYITNILKDKTGFASDVFSERYEFTGKYGNTLGEEVFRYSLIAVELAMNNTFDVIHAHDWLTYPAGIAAKQITGKPLIVHVHATEFDRSGENVNQYVYDIERKGMEMADKVITVSNYTRDIVIKRYGIDPAKVVTVHNGVDFDSRDFKSYPKHVNEKVVTFLGRVTFQKGPDYFVEAAYKVLQKDPNVRFVMAGSGDMLYRMIRRVAQLGISTKFHFTGFLKGEDVDNMLYISDVYVMPSVSEPFGISPLEAMRSNTPVIISKQSGVAEVLRYALKVDFWDIDGLANSIYGLLHYEALSKMFVRLGKEEVEKLMWDKAAFSTKQIYESVIK